MKMMVEQLQQAKLVLLGEMGSGKTSLVQRYVRGHYYENQVNTNALSIAAKLPQALSWPIRHIFGRE